MTYRRSSTSATRRRRSRRWRAATSAPTRSTPEPRCCRSSAFTADELPSDEGEAFDEAKAGFEEKNLTALPPTPFVSSNEVAVTKETADKLGLKKISDLEGKSQDLTLYGSPECRQRLDCKLGLEQVYGLKFKKFVPWTSPCATRC